MTLAAIVEVDQLQYVIIPSGDLSATLAAQARYAAAIAENSAAVAEAFAGPTYANQAAGEAATTTGQYFAVNASGIVSIYERTGGGSTLVRTMLTTTALAGTGGAALVGMANGNNLEEEFTGTIRDVEYYGPTNTGVAAAAAVAAGVAALPLGATLFNQEAISVGTAPVANNTAILKGAAIHYDAGAGLGKQVQNKAGMEFERGKFGIENLARWLFLVRTLAATKVAIIGNSKGASYYGAELATLLAGIPNCTVTNYAVSGSTLHNWINNAGTVNGTGNHMAAVIAAAPDLTISFYDYTNEPLVGPRTLAEFATDLETALAAIRGSLPIESCGILLCTGSAQRDGANGRDELPAHQARTALYNKAIKHRCAWLDLLSVAPDSSVDAASGGFQNKWIDAAGVHPEPPHTTLLANHVADYILPKGYIARAVLGDHIIVPSAVYTPANADASNKYPIGETTMRALTASGFPADGYLNTIRHIDGTGAIQTNWASNNGYRYKRQWRATDSAWSVWLADGIIDVTNMALTEASAITAWPFGRSSSRADPADGWDLDGYVETFREPNAGNYGYQDLFKYNGDVQTKRRVYTNAGWGVWRDL